MSPQQQSEIIGWLAIVPVLLSYILTALKVRWVWWLNIGLILAFTYVNAILGLVGFVVCDVIALGINLWGWRKWKTQE